jgi:hypothetical protein
MVWERPETTILPSTHRPGGRLVGSHCGYSVTHDWAPNHANLESNIEPNNDADNRGNNVSNNVSNNDSNNESYSDGLRSRFRLRFSAGLSCRRSLLSSSRHLCRYFLTNNGGYFEGYNEPLA